MGTRLRHLLAGALLVVTLLAAATTAHAGEPAWTSLFDSKSLNGWIQRGGAAKYEVRDGTIVGTTVPNTKNSFLCTEKSYGDFVLEVEFKVDPQLNSGIQIRGQSRADYQDWRVHGYQVEIDPDVKRNRMWTGGIYEEGRRGWLANLEHNEAARKVFKSAEWNKLRIEAMGASIKTWLNGVPAADLVDSMDMEGFIALQVHQVGKREEPLQVAWRNIRIQDHGRRAWRPLFDGKSIKGFRAAGGGSWTVKEGVLAGVMKKEGKLAMEGPSTRNGLLSTERALGDFTARLEYRLAGADARAPAGLVLRTDHAPWPVGVKGLSVSLDAAKGVIGVSEGPAGSIRPEPNKGWKPGDWNQLSVSARGADVRVHSNGTLFGRSEYPGPTEGPLALMIPPGQDVRFEVRRFEVLSDPIPPAVPGFPIGWCIRAQGSAPDDAKAAGFEYVELALQDVLSLNDEEFERAVARFAALGVPALVGYNIIPAELMIVGPAADKARQDEHLQKALARAARLGLKMVVLNGGASRRAPEGFPLAEAWKQLVDFSKRAAEAAKKHQITFLVQPLRVSETNMVTNVPDALKLVKAVRHPNFELLVDYSFMALQNEDPAVLAKARGHLKHVWIANPGGRVYPMSAGEADYAAFFRALQRIGYRGGVSIHARTDNFFADAPPAMAFLRKMAAEHLAR